ncbi:hypothetical protein niasHT_012251 [Heterodera trifolii]|uniref:Uncharacterized protein n=1 Tax=Heterodera trifolii TaxID=157864 RepID=A0ABD2KXS2_9BILA
MQRAIKYFQESFALDSVEKLYAHFKEEILSAPGEYYPNPLCVVDCVHIVNDDHPDLPVFVEGTLDLIGGLELYSTCYPRTEARTINWSEVLYLELKDMMICRGESARCRCAQPIINNNLSHYQLIVDELDRWLMDNHQHNRRDVVEREEDGGNADRLTWLQTVHLKNNIMISANSLSFHSAGSLLAYRGFLSITVEQHLYVRHRVRLRFPFLPCVAQYGGNHHHYYFPLELLEICSRQTDEFA